MTALDPHLREDFGEMVELGQIDSIDDIKLINYFRLDGELDVHAEYGYLVNETTAQVVAGWWRTHRPGIGE